MAINPVVEKVARGAHAHENELGICVANWDELSKATRQIYINHALRILGIVGDHISAAWEIDRELQEALQQAMEVRDGKTGN